MNTLYLCVIPHLLLTHFYTGKTRQIGNEGRASEFANRYGKFGAFKSK